MRTAICISSIFLLIMLSLPTMADDIFVYFGSHGAGPHIGFSLAHFDTDTGNVSEPVFLEEAEAPAYFIIRPDSKRLYTCNSSPGASLSAYAIDPITAKLTLLNQQPSGGGDPSYVSLDPNDRYLLVANYLGGSAAVFALRPTGALVGERRLFSMLEPAWIRMMRNMRIHTRSASIPVIALRC
jgi:6-phosphogluconolactonase